MMSGPHIKRDDTMTRRSVTSGYDFNSPVALLPQQIRRSETGEPDQASNKWKRSARILIDLKRWGNAILVTSCVIAVVLDPLFFYIPYVDEEKRCLGIDKQVLAAALVFRSVTDVIYLVRIIYQLHEAIRFAASKVSADTNRDGNSRKQIIQFAKEFSGKLSWRSFLTDVVSVFPLPQLLIVVFFNMGGDNFVQKTVILNGFLLVQYVPRIYRIYLSFTMVTESVLRIKGAFHFFLYILASHVLGASWYLFSIHRELTCWYYSCPFATNPSITESNCTFYCHSNSQIMTKEFNNTLRERCILKVPYDMIDPPFDFGIFFDSLKNDIQGKRKFSRKIGYCFWWGLRNLSNFGTSLETSTHLWENCFAILISITGLLLFLYLIGNVQISLLKGTTRKEEIREKKKEIREKKKEEITEKLKRRRNDIVNWMDTIGLEAKMKKEIEKGIKRKLEEDINADLNDLFSVLPGDTQRDLKRKLCMSTLRKIPRLSNVDEKVLEMMCDYLKKVSYRENTLVFQRGEPIDRMIFITEGSMWSYTPATESSHFQKGTGPLATFPSVNTNELTNGDCYGDVLLQFASSSPRALPASVDNVRCHTMVEAFVLMANDLRNIITSNKELWLSSTPPAAELAMKI